MLTHKMTCFLPDGNVLIMEEDEDGKVYGEIRNAQGEPTRQYSDWSIAKILKHFQVREYSAHPYAKETHP